MSIRNGCSLPLSDWADTEYTTAAQGEVQMSDGNRYVVLIQVDDTGNITWTASS
jgi:hypothetical protein